MTLQDLDTMTLDELIEVCDTDPEHVAIAKPAAKMIVSKSFAERWTTNPDHYREHFTGFSGEIEVQG